MTAWPVAPLSVLVVDDEAPARARLRMLLGDCTAPTARVVGEAADAAQALACLARTGCDVVLLDIALPARTGLQLAANLQAHAGSAHGWAAAQAPAIVFVTAHADHALQAFELDAVDYLTKPVRLERLQAALARVVQRRAAGVALAPAPPDAVSGDDGVIVVQDRQRLLRVPLASVLYLKAELKYLTVRTATASHVLDGALNDFEQRLGTDFLRIHRSALVARRAVRALERMPMAPGESAAGAEAADQWQVVLAGVDERLPVSRRQLPSVRAALASRCGGRGA